MIYIMAQGKGSRWEDNEIPYKQFIPVGNTTIIERTMDMIAGKSYFPVCSSKFAEHFKETHPYISLREPPQDLLIGMVEAMGTIDFEEDITFLLGDVVYSKKMMEAIISSSISPHSIIAFGRRGKNFFTGKDAGEIFAIKLRDWYIKPFKKHVRYMQENKLGGKLWHYVLSHDVPIFNIGVDDWTDDIDSYAEYVTFGKRVISLAEAEYE